MSSIEKALKSRLVMLAGEEGFLRMRALRDILEKLNVSPDDFDFQILDGPSSTPVDWLAAAGTAPFLAERRTVVVRHVLNCDPERLKGVSLGNLPETAFLVLVADDDGGSDDRIRRQKDARRILQQAVGRAGGELLEFNPDPKAAKDAVRREAAEAGKAMSERSAQVLVEMTGGSLSRALEELQKLIIYVADNPSIGEREILAIAVPSREWSVFRLADAIISNQVALALKQLKILVGSSPKPEDSAFRAILPQLSRTLRLVWQARLCIDAGCSPAEPTSKVLSMFPAKPNLANEQPYRQSQIMGSARKTSLYEVALALQVLSDTDARLKGGLPSFSTVEALERMVLDMAVALNSRRRTG